jgi:hypothetical protein
MSAIMACMAEKTAAELIVGRIEELGDWRGKLLADIRAAVKAAAPDVVEEWKWRGVPTWYVNGTIVCTGETYKDKVKVTFHKGAELDGQTDLYNSSLEGGTRRAIDWFEGDKLDKVAFKKLVKQAAALNTPKKKR